jgi:hypothetical protein
MPLELLIKEINKFHKSTKIVDRHWLWVGGSKLKGGHVLVMIGGRKGRRLLLHRYIFCLLHKLDYNDKSFTVNHICNISNCWSPLCLYKGTQRDNIIDSVVAKTHHMSRRNLCSKGHKFSLRSSTRDGITRRCKICERDRKSV